MRLQLRRTTIGLALVAATVLSLAACSSSSSGGGASTATSTSAAAAGSAAGSGTPVAVTEKEFSITLATTSFKAGTYTFNVTNSGSFPHNLKIAGPGVAAAGTAKIAPGGTGSVTVTFQAGSYELWCGVPTHKEKGMDMTITVT
jgi:plastocyanin